MINRSAVLIRLKSPFIDWINECDPADQREKLTLEEANEDRTIYLIEEEEAEHVDQWIAMNFMQVFECELEDWIADPELWPRKITKEMFHEWCDVECHSVIVDTVGGPILEDEDTF